MHIQGPPTSMGDEALDAVIAKALANDPAERHPSCAELVEAAAEAAGVVAPPVVADPVGRGRMDKEGAEWTSSG